MVAGDRRPRSGRLSRLAVPLLLGVVLVVVENSAEPPGRSAVGHPVDGVVALVLAAAPTDDPYHGQLCGGVLVAPDTVLTAAHCVSGRAPSSIDAIIGADNLCLGRPIDGTRLPVTAIAFHPAYDPATGRLDLATLTLAGDAPGRTRLVARLGDQGPEATATAYGWAGAAEGLPRTCRLQHVRLRGLADADCSARLGPGPHAFDPGSMLCADPAWGANTCHGDSGGPLVAGTDGDGRGALLGVVSWGRSCDGVGVYARASGWPFAAVDGAASG